MGSNTGIYKYILIGHFLFKMCQRFEFQLNDFTQLANKF